MNIAIASPPNTEHRVSAVLASALASMGYSSPMVEDYYASLIASRVAEHRGTVIHSQGSVVCMEFEEAANAVNCAIDMLERFAHHNRIKDEGDRVLAKMSVHYGEVFFSEGRSIGAGLEGSIDLLSLVPAEMIYITREVFLRIRSLLNLQIESLGKKSLAAFPEPKEILSIAWTKVTTNLQESLRKLSDEDIDVKAEFSPKRIVDASRKVSPFVLMILFLIIFFILKMLKVL